MLAPTCCTKFSESWSFFLHPKFLADTTGDAQVCAVPRLQGVAQGERMSSSYVRKRRYRLPEAGIKAGDGPISPDVESRGNHFGFNRAFSYHSHSDHFTETIIDVDITGKYMLSCFITHRLTAGS